MRPGRSVPCFLAGAAWAPAGPRREATPRGLRVAVVPVIAALLAIGVLAAERIERCPPPPKCWP
jgi:hypothetical protein